MPVDVNEELLNECTKAALDWVHDHTSPESQQHISDDGYDYLVAALDFAKLMLELQIDNDLGRLKRILSTEGTFSYNFADLPPFIIGLKVPANDETWMECDEGTPLPPVPEGIR